MTELSKTSFIIQCIDKEISSNKVHELKEELDKDYKYVVGIAISNVNASENSILEQVKIKGMDVLPEKFEAAHIMSSGAVAPNKRFFSWFKPVPVSGDELIIRFYDPDWAISYNLQVQILLTNNLEEIINVLFA
ncbi:MAG TPA: hypothetical protein PKN32_10625 [Bacteroidales bacterium]|nr:hypothetical protein [Bacteroidales bacterium]